MLGRYGVMVWLFLLNSCVTEQEINPLLDGTNILGPWKLTEYVFSPGGPEIPRSQVVEDKTLIFSANGTVFSHGYFQCDQGKYALEGNTLTIVFDCEEELEKREFSLSWENDKLVMVPSSPICIEYCAYVFVNKTF